MRFTKTIISVSCVTALALLYVHQQVELVKLSYTIEQREKTLKSMLDHNESLGYNIDNLEAPSRLEQVLIAKKIDVSFPKRSHVVKVARLSAPIKGISASPPPQKGLGIWGLFEFISPAREAQAKEK